jgi:hypothetical protein
MLRWNLKCIMQGVGDMGTQLLGYHWAFISSPLGHWYVNFSFVFTNILSRYLRIHGLHDNCVRRPFVDVVHTSHRFDHRIHLSLHGTDHLSRVVCETQNCIIESCLARRDSRY